VAISLIAGNDWQDAPANDRFSGLGGWDPGWHRIEG